MPRLPNMPDMDVRERAIVEHFGADPSTIEKGSVRLDITSDGGEVTWTEVRRMAPDECNELIFLIDNAVAL